MGCQNGKEEVTLSGEQSFGGLFVIPSGLQLQKSAD